MRPRPTEGEEAPLEEIHPDRDVRKWCAWYRCTMTGGDDFKSNGRVENEIHQLRRRLRVLMGSTGAPPDWCCWLVWG